MAPISKIASAVTILMMATTALAAPAGIDSRQIGGEATAAYGVINNVDNGLGYMTENLEDGVANGMKPGSGGNTEYGQYGDGAGSPPAGPPSRRSRLERRQGNKIVNGLGPVLSDAGQPGLGNAVQTTGDQEDETLTSGAGNIGTEVGGLEEGTLSEAGYGAGLVAESALQEAGGAGGAKVPGGA